jgi:mRNA interferase RelE/StbE
MPGYRVLFKPSADKALRKLPESVQKRIAAAAEELGDDPRQPGCVKLKGEDDLWRIRVGDYRVVYAIQGDELLVLVVRVAHRKDVYRG